MAGSPGRTRSDAHAPDARAERLQLGVDVFVAAIDLVHAADHRAALGAERGHDERDARPDVGARDADQLVHEEEPALVHLLVEEHRAFRLGRRHQRHAHEVGGKGGPWAIVDGRDGVAEVGTDGQRLARGQDEVVAVGARAHAEPPEDAQRHAQVLEAGVLHDDLAAGHRGQRHEAADLHEVRPQRELGAAQPRHAVDAEQVGADAVDAGAHRGQELARFLDVRLARRVAQHGGALGQRRRQHDVLRRRHARLVQQDVGAAQRPAAQHEPVVLLNDGAERLQPEHVGVDTPAADLVAAGALHARLTLAREQRSHQHQAAAHPAQEVGVRCRRGDPSRAQGDGVRVVAIHLDAELLDQAEHRPDVGDVGEVLQTHRLVGEQRGGDEREGGVLVAARCDRPLEGHPALDDELVHGHDDDMVRETMFRFVHITDTHIMAGGTWRIRGTDVEFDTDASLRRVVETVRRLQPAPAFAVLGGDLASPDILHRERTLTPAEYAPSYARLREILGELPCRAHFLMGNHDNLEAFNRALRPEAPAPDAPCYYSFDHDGTHLIALDSHEPGHADGVLDPAQLAWLARDLAAHRDTPTIVFVHHHPWPLGHAWMDTMTLRNGGELMAMLARQAQVRWLIGGHVHSEQLIQRGGLTMLTTPSTCIQLSKVSGPAHFDPGPPGFRVVDVEDGRLSTFVVHVR